MLPQLVSLNSYLNKFIDSALNIGLKRNEVFFLTEVFVDGALKQTENGLQSYF